MGGELSTPLTVAKLKALCVLNDLPSTGRKHEIIERLLDNGMSAEELKLENYQPPKQQKDAEDAETSDSEEQPSEEAEKEIIISLDTDVDEDEDEDADGSGN